MLVLAGADERDLTKLAEYEAIGGYQALQKARGMPPQAVIDEVIASELRGRGGAFFPTGRKWSFVPKPDQNPNPALPRRQRRRVRARQLQGQRDHGARSAPLHRGLPDRRARGRVERTSSSTSAASTPDPYEILVGALEELQGRPDLLGGVTIVLHRGAGAYICGEETALLESLEGKRGQPRTKPPFPAVAGAVRVADRREQRRDAGDAAADHRDGRRRVREARRAGLARHARRLDLRARPAAGQLRDRERHEHARADLRARRRHHRAGASSRPSSPAARRL